MVNYSQLMSSLLRKNASPDRKLEVEAVCLSRRLVMNLVVMIQRAEDTFAKTATHITLGRRLVM